MKDEYGREYVPMEDIVTFVSPYIRSYRDRKEIQIKETRSGVHGEAIYTIQLDTQEIIGEIIVWSQMTFEFSAIPVKFGTCFLNFGSTYSTLDDLVPFLQVMERIFIG